MRRYLASVDTSELGRRRWEDPEIRPGNDVCRLVEARVTDELGEPATTFLSSQPVVVTIEFDLLRTDPAFTAGFDLVTGDGAVVFRSAYTDAPEASRPRLVKGRNAIRCEIPAGLLNSGRYGINVQMQLHNSQLLVAEVGALGFDVDRRPRRVPVPQLAGPARGRGADPRVERRRAGDGRRRGSARFPCAPRDPSRAAAGDEACEACRVALRLERDARRARLTGGRSRGVPRLRAVAGRRCEPVAQRRCSRSSADAESASRAT